MKSTFGGENITTKHTDSIVNSWARPMVHQGVHFPEYLIFAKIFGQFYLFLSIVSVSDNTNTRLVWIDIKGFDYFFGERFEVNEIVSSIGRAFKNEHQVNVRIA